MTEILTEPDNRNRLQFLMPSEKNAVLEFSRLIKERFGQMVKEIVLFGSRARGEDDKESDIDILIVLASLSWEIKKTISEIAAAENLKYDVFISTIRYDVATWNNPVIKSSPFGVEVRRDGIWL
ncbi:MAG: nucleotidyltransferase domain-containing protein [Nitrospirae bacterium]|nr:nucleotidyltransferase domain-containing protein [Nitrospirota bacterium]